MFSLTINKRNILIIGIGILVLLAVFFIFRGKSIKVENKIKPPAGGEKIAKECDYSKRPMAIMLASDSITRPLSGISETDVVFEMPVTENGVTRMMAVYYCGQPEEIGSVRSARKEFIPLAKYLDVIYAHWGGEKNALEDLDKGVLDNIDAMKYENIYYYRKKGVKMPHNGFTSYQLLIKGAKELNYNLQSDLKIEKSLVEKVKNIGRDLLTVDQPQIINVGYNPPFDVIWRYDPQENKYLRIRNGEPEIDKNNNQQVKVDKVILLTTTWTPVNILYIDVRVAGKGSAVIYEGGRAFKGSWEKSGDSIKNPLIIRHDDGKRVELLPGKTWVHYIF